MKLSSRTPFSPLVSDQNFTDLHVGERIVIRGIQCEARISRINGFSCWVIFDDGTLGFIDVLDVQGLAELTDGDTQPVNR